MKKPRKHPAKEARIAKAIYEAEVRAMKAAIPPLTNSK